MAPSEYSPCHLGGSPWPDYFQALSRALHKWLRVVPSSVTAELSLCHVAANCEGAADWHREGVQRVGHGVVHGGQPVPGERGCRSWTVNSL
jgi:hypothetical protein